MKPFIICEIGSNWRHLHDCLHSIAMAKQVGADAVKFQLFTPEALYGTYKDMSYEYETAYGFVTGSPCLPIDWLPKLKEKADACGIEFMCTAFSPELAEVVNPYVRRHKVASSDINYYPLLKKLESFKKPVYMSTGASTKADISQALLHLDANFVTLLYCVGSYPARSVDLGVIRVLRESFSGISIGYSDHSTDVYGHPVMACRDYGASVLEKHFSVIPNVSTPDGPHSLGVDDFARMVRAIQSNPQILPTFEESSFPLRHRRRLVATAKIIKGSRFCYGSNFGMHRALTDDVHGLNVAHAERLNECYAAEDIPAGTPIAPRMVSGVRSS